MTLHHRIDRSHRNRKHLRMVSQLRVCDKEVLVIDAVQCDGAAGVRPRSV